MLFLLMPRSGFMELRIPASKLSCEDLAVCTAGACEWSFEPSAACLERPRCALGDFLPCPFFFAMMAQTPAQNDAPQNGTIGTALLYGRHPGWRGFSLDG
eukprot:6197204-Pleurochrysis_carterae.AAC.4